MFALRKTTGARIVGSTDPLWWGVAALLSLGSLWMPRFLSFQSDEMSRVVVVEASLFLTGAFLGCLRPRRVWRWAIASLIAIASRDVVWLYSDPNLSQMTFLQMGDYMTANWEMYFVQVLPVLIGAQAGSFISSAGLE